MPVKMLPQRLGSDPRMAELDRLIMAGRGDEQPAKKRRAKSQPSRWKKNVLDRTAARMREKYGCTRTVCTGCDANPYLYSRGMCRRCYRQHIKRINEQAKAAA